MSAGAVGVFASPGLCYHNGSLTWRAVGAVFGWELICGSLWNNACGLSMQSGLLHAWQLRKKIEDARSFKAWQSPRMPVLLPSNKHSLSMRSRMCVKEGWNWIKLSIETSYQNPHFNHIFIISNITKTTYLSVLQLSTINKSYNSLIHFLDCPICCCLPSSTFISDTAFFNSRIFIWFYIVVSILPLTFSC